MSNVLIGIIGVVLFIGLALAGALLLGSDFMIATTDSKASAISQGLQQVAAAANMYQLKTGQAATPGDVGSSALIGRFLKAAPANPSMPGNGAIMVDGSGYSTSSMPASTVIMRVADAATCESIQRGSGMIASGDAFNATAQPDMSASSITGPAGCFVGPNGARYWAFVKL